MSKLQLEVVTPDKKVVSAEVDYVSCPGIEGEFGVMPQHVSMLSGLKIGALRYDSDGKHQFVFISGGFADVNNGTMSVLAESAELAEDIDAARAQAAKARAEKRLAERGEKLDVVRAEAALQRAMVRLNLVAQAR
ncbi:MAG: F0F1 ATP synthase subunit epsilon [Desulfovibrionaceae bacterium]|nr:F0F1 ATP synthase subunit epsilon [Desulfovibrionaceae bacterium]